MINLLFDFILLTAVGLVLRRNVSIKKVFLGALVGALSIFLLFISLNSFTLFIYKLVISILMVIVTFGFKDIKYTAKNLLFLYTISMILGGFLYYLNIEFSYKNEGIIFFHNGLSINVIVLIIISPVIVYIYIRQALELKNHYAHCYKVDLYFKDGTVKKLNGFLDTGNNLYDPYNNRPIILVDPKEVNFELDEYNTILVPYETIDNHGLLKCIMVDKVYIVGVGEKHNVLVGISKEKIKIEGINCILHSKLLEG
jgi:stage II sporulation protein GA (sporulation sigma-E factor processing peptidase)